jgi:hypothetical protein
VLEKEKAIRSAQGGTPALGSKEQRHAQEIQLLEPSFLMGIPRSRSMC